MTKPRWAIRNDLETDICDVWLDETGDAENTATAYIVDEELAGISIFDGIDTIYRDRDEAVKLLGMEAIYLIEDEAIQEMIIRAEDGDDYAYDEWKNDQ